ncbi:hypothetical protein EI94DRAFT_1709316 [Lactarius quietus]|nr:hypothetical protein EI94DRAFT_1709316 [Lactarius quietus]
MGWGMGADLSSDTGIYLDGEVGYALSPHSDVERAIRGRSRGKDKTRSAYMRISRVVEYSFVPSTIHHAKRMRIERGSLRRDTHKLTKWGPNICMILRSARSSHPLPFSFTMPSIPDALALTSSGLLSIGFAVAQEMMICMPAVLCMNVPREDGDL